MAKQQGGGGSQNSYEPFVLLLLGTGLIMALAYIIWTYYRQIIVLPVFAVAWGEYYALSKISLLDKTGFDWWNFIEEYLTRKVDITSLSWNDFTQTLWDIGDRTYMFLAFAIFVLMAVVIMKMQGEGMKRSFTLTGKGLENVYRFMGWAGISNYLKACDPGRKGSFVQWILPQCYLFRILKSLKVITKKEEWVPNGVSFAHYQAKEWKVALIGANFDPNKEDKNEMPQKKPMEWIRDHKITFSRREGLDEDQCTEAFESQLGTLWQGIEKAPAYLQILAFMAALNVKKDRRLSVLKDQISELYATKDVKTAEAELKKILIPYLADKKIVNGINKKGSKHAYTNTAMIGIMGWGGPIGEWGGGNAGVLSTSMYRWLKRVDRTLWYCLNNIGRRAFHIEGAGAVNHFFTERVSRQPIMKPRVEEALEGLIMYLDDKGIEDSAEYFHRESDFD